MNAGAAPPRLVLDTNVWLDWLVFADAAIEPLRHARAANALEICINEVCERELAAVLAYDLGKHTLDMDAQTARLAEFRRLISAWPARAPPRADNTLPKCRDPDDQKFLELARDCGADYLVTKDRALLVLARRKTRPPPCRIVTPTEFGAILGGGFSG
jgi:putative PIN family toxin of toxin-antitoxin system